MVDRRAPRTAGQVAPVPGPRGIPADLLYHSLSLMYEGGRAAAVST